MPSPLQRLPLSTVLNRNESLCVKRAGAGHDSPLSEVS